MQRWSETDKEWLDLYVFNEKNLSLQNDFNMMNFYVANCDTSMFQKVILAPSLPEQLQGEVHHTLHIMRRPNPSLWCTR